MKYLWLVPLLVGCSESVDATLGDRAARADAAATGGRAGASGNGGATGTAGGGGDRDAMTHGGNGGAVVRPEGGPCAPLEGGTGTWSPGFSNDPGECKTCVEALGDYCAGNGCVPLSQWNCGPYGSGGIVILTIERGCGHLKFSFSGDVGDHWGRVYDESTGKVVYGWNNGRLSAGCTDAIVAGALPACSSWTTVRCADGGIPSAPGRSDGGSDGAAP